MALLLLLVLAAAAAAPSPATQLRLTFHPDPDTLVAGFTSMGAAPPGATLVQSGPAPNALGAPSSGTFVVFGNEYCPLNSSRTSHAAPFPAPAGAVTYYRVSADGGATWSNVTAAHNPARGFPMSIALWGDMGVECGGVLPPQPGFAGGPCTAVPQIAADSVAGVHAWTAHFGGWGESVCARGRLRGRLLKHAITPSSRPFRPLPRRQCLQHG